MPDLKELYDKFKTKATSGLEAMGEAVSSPLQTLGGVASEAGNILSGVRSLAMDIPQSFAPVGVKLPYSSGVIAPEGSAHPVIQHGTPAGAEWKQRLAMLLNVPSMGMANQVAENYGKTGSVDSALYETAKEFLPFQELKALASGESRKHPGQQIAPEEYGENLTSGILKAIPVFKGLKGIAKWSTTGVKPNIAANPLRSISEMEASQAELASTMGSDSIANMAKYQKLKSEYNSLPKDALPETKLKLGNELGAVMEEAMTERGFTPDMTRQLINNVPTDVLASNMMEQLVKYKENGGTVDRVSTQAIELLGSNQVAVSSVVDMMRKYDMTPEQTAATMPLILDGLRKGATDAGRTMKVYSDLQQMVQAKMFRNNPLLKDHLTGVLEAMKFENSPQTFWQKLNNSYSKIEQIWRGAAVSSPTTAARNFTGGVANFGSSLFDDMLSGGERYLAGKVLKLDGPAPTFAESMWPFLNKLTTMQEVAFGGSKNLKQWWDYMQALPEDRKLLSPVGRVIDAIDAEYPGPIRNVFSGPVQDIAVMNITDSGLRSAIPKAIKAWGEVETVHDAAKFGTSLLNTFNTMQEMFWRKFYFTSRLRDNVRRFGFETPEEMMKSLAEEKRDVPHYFGEQHTPQSLAELQFTGELTKRISSLEDKRIDNYEAQKGSTLHSTERDIAGVQHGKLSKDLNGKFEKLKGELDSGKDWETIKGDIDPELAQVLGGKIDKRSTAITDAADYALKQTFAYTPPKGNLGYTIMKMYEELPMLYTLATPFPRFMINATQWVVEHEPTELAKIASPKFMKMMAETAADPTKLVNPQSVRSFERAHTGAALWAAAHYIHNDKDLSGPKYYQMNLGPDEDGNNVYADLRPYNPFVQFMFIEHTMKSVLKGETPNLTAAELTEALLGLRRLSEVPIFAFPDIIRQVDSSSPDAFANSLKPLLGQWMAGAFTPFRMFGDIAGAMGVEEAVHHKDMAGNELTGPTIGQIPILREVLPDRVDPFTGKPSGQEHPGVRLLGPNLHHATTLEQEISKTGMPLNDLLGNYADPEADRLVRKHLGQMLGTRLNNGKLLANELGEAIRNATSGQSIEVHKTVIRELYTQLREEAKAKAMAENPYAFIENEIRQRPEAERPMLRELVKQYEPKKVELMRR